MVQRTVRASRAMGVCVALLGGTARYASGQALESPPFLRRINADVAWFGHYGRTDQWSYFTRGLGERSSHGALDLSGTGLGQGLALDVAVRITRKFGVGAEGWVERRHYALSSPLANALGIRFGQREYVGISAIVEYLPGSRDYAARRGWFIRGSLGSYASFNHPQSSRYKVGTDEPWTKPQVGLNCGYRFVYAEPYSVGLAGFGRGGADGLALGLRLEGGFQ